MNLRSARLISGKYGLQCSEYSFNHTIHIHFLDGAGFYLATRRTKNNKTLALLSETSERRFRSMCRKVEHHLKTEAEKNALQILIDFRKYVPRSTTGIPGIRYYPEFRLFTLMSDGFPEARFIFSEDFSRVFFAFSKDRTLQYRSNPRSIPHIFPVEELTKWLGHCST